MLSVTFSKHVSNYTFQKDQQLSFSTNVSNSKLQTCWRIQFSKLLAVIVLNILTILFLKSTDTYSFPLHDSNYIFRNANKYISKRIAVTII